MVRPSGGVLVVDDDDGVRSVLASGLRRQGFVIWPAAGGREAVEIYRSYRGSIGMVLLDVRMPDQDGPETLAALRRFDPHVRACFVTGDAGRYTEQDLLDLGALAVFRKPPGLAELGERLAALMNRLIWPVKREAPPTWTHRRGNRERATVASFSGRSCPLAVWATSETALPQDESSPRPLPCGDGRS